MTVVAFYRAVDEAVRRRVLPEAQSVERCCRLFVNPNDWAAAQAANNDEQGATLHVPKNFTEHMLGRPMQPNSVGLMHGIETFTDPAVPSGAVRLENLVEG